MWFLLILISSVSALLRTCKPTFHEKFISGSDEVKMRWEYCTKMTFSKNGYAEWHAMASYANKWTFDKLFMNYLIENRHTEPEWLD